MRVSRYRDGTDFIHIESVPKEILPMVFKELEVIYKQLNNIQQEAEKQVKIKRNKEINKIIEAWSKE